MTPKKPGTYSRTIRLLSASIISVFAVVLLSGCASTAHSTPYYGYGHTHPGWYEYYYYPDVDVYYDPYRHYYHYHHGTRGWLTVTVLPSYIHLNRHSYHVIRSRHQKLWNYNHDYKRQHIHHEDYRKKRYDNRHDEKRYHGSENNRGSQPLPRVTYKKVVVIKNDSPRKYPDTGKARERGINKDYRKNPGGHTYVSSEARRLAEQHRREMAADQRKQGKQAEKYTRRKDKAKTIAKKDRWKGDREARREEHKKRRNSFGGER